MEREIRLSGTGRVGRKKTDSRPDTRCSGLAGNVRACQFRVCTRESADTGRNCVLPGFTSRGFITGAACRHHMRAQFRWQDSILLWRKTEYGRTFRQSFCQRDKPGLQRDGFCQGLTVLDGSTGYTELRLAIEWVPPAPTRLLRTGRAINSAELQPGDLLVQLGGDSHVVMFLGWNADGTILGVHESGSAKQCNGRKGSCGLAVLPGVLD